MKNIICLTEVEIDTFLPSGGLAEAQKLMGPYILVTPENLDREAWADLIENCDPEIILAAWETPMLPEHVRDRAPNLKYVCYLPGSVRKLIPRSAIEQGLMVTNWGSSISRTIAECALMLVLCCMRRVCYWTQQMHYEGAWKDGESTTQSLFEKRVGLHGFGAISRQLVILLKPFTNRISACSPGVPQSIFDESGVARIETLEELFSENDVVVELSALTEKNYRIVTEDLLRRIPEGGAFVNVGRGALVDEDALYRIAKEGKIQIGLDVYGEEPLPETSPFRGLSNVLLLPHLGGPTTDRRADAGDHGLENLRRYRNSGELLDNIDLDKFDRAS